MIRIIVFMVTIIQGAHFCNGCSSLVPDIDVGLDAVVVDGDPEGFASVRRSVRCIGMVLPRPKRLPEEGRRFPT